jgi:Na+-translocating ferredoxin:NAD+ oxidoreductase subunit G
MAKLESNLKTMVLSLFGVCAVASGLLGYMNSITEGPIAESKAKAKLEAIQKVVPEFNNNPGEEMYTLPSDLGDLECFPAKMDGQLVGTAISTKTNIAFSGSFTVMVGIKPDGTLIDTSVLDHKETPGLGTKMKDAKFKDQFLGKDPVTNKIKVRKDGGEIDAITAATITSRAFCDAVMRAYNAYQKGGQK